MSKLQKTLIGAASLLPLLLFIILMVRYVQMIKELILSKPATSDDAGLLFIQDMFATLMPLAILSLIVHIALLVLFIILAVRDKRLAEVEQVVWIIAFFIAGLIAFPLFFFMRILPRASHEVSQAYNHAEIPPASS